MKLQPTLLRTLGATMPSRRSVHTMSTIFRTARHIPSQKSKGPDSESSLSQKLMLENGLIRSPSTGGFYHLLPIALRSLEKLVGVIDDVMEEYSCQKIQMSTLTAASLWKTSGRLDEAQSELLTLRDRHSKRYLLSPTHEEAVCDLLRDYPWSYRNLPLRLYQITNKFRDEMKPRFGLLRTKEFLMKDLYTFDVDEKAALDTYAAINEAYSKLLDRLGVNYVKVEGLTGLIGGTLSHEYHLGSKVGEDELYLCRNCNFSFNKELFRATGIVPDLPATELQCPKCDSTDLNHSYGIEVGHTFLLGKKYTSKLRTTYLGANGKHEVMEMGCYGIGVTRLLAGIIEVMSDNGQMRWPMSIAPYVVGVIPPKAGSKEERAGEPVLKNIVDSLRKLFPKDLLLDDRVDMTIGKRLQDMQKLGIPYIVVIGKGVTESSPTVELYDVNGGSRTDLSVSDANGFVEQLKDIHAFSVSHASGS